MPLEDQAVFKLDGPDIILAGSVQPAGRAERAADGWRISGRWPFASGCDHADWITGFCLVMENGQPLPAPNGAPGPMIRTVVLPKAEWQIEDTWHAAGLKGTGSHHVVLENKLVPPELFIDSPMGPAQVAGPLYQNAFTVAPIALTPIAVGIAEAALGDVIELAKTGRQQVRATAPMRESEVFQLDLGRAAAEIDGARAMMRSRAAEFWDLLLADAPIGEAHAIRALQTAAWIVETATRAVDICYTLGGGSAVYETSPLQRRLRDIHAIAGHVFVQRRHYASAGKLLLQDE